MGRFNGFGTHEFCPARTSPISPIQESSKEHPRLQEFENLSTRAEASSINFFTRAEASSINFSTRAEASSREKSLTLSLRALIRVLLVFAGGGSKWFPQCPGTTAREVAEMPEDR